MTIEKQTYRSGPYQDYFAQGTLVGKVLYISGQIGIDAEGNIPASISAQTKNAYANLQDVLTQFGAEMSNIVDETLFVTEMEEFMAHVEEVYNAREEAYGSNPEVCQTIVQVTGLALPDLKIEIKCVAHI
jgi:enamine deaminase RidA (YjgF/YER057c/UK114 family)